MYIPTISLHIAVGEKARFMEELL